MPKCFFALIRFWLRIDNVLFRVYETRIYHEFEKKYLLREFHSKESSWHSVSQVTLSFPLSILTINQMLPPDQTKFNDANLISPLLKTKSVFTEKIVVNKI